MFWADTKQGGKKRRTEFRTVVLNLIRFKSPFTELKAPLVGLKAVLGK